MTCGGFLTADEYLYCPLLVPAGPSVRPPTVWVPMLSPTQERHGHVTTITSFQGSCTLPSLTRLLCGVDDVWRLGGGLPDCSDDGGTASGGGRTGRVLGRVATLE